MKETEKALVTLLEAGNTVTASLADDGRIDFKESMQISLKAISLIGIFRKLPEIKVEIQERTPEKIAHLVAVFKEKFVLQNKEAEEKIEQGLDVLYQLSTMVFIPKKA